MPVWTLHAEVLDAPAQDRAAALVDLDGHEPVGELDDVGLEAQAAQGVGRLQAEQPAADDGAAAAAGGEVLDGLEVVERAVDEAAGQVLAGDGRHERERAVARTRAS